MKIDDAEHNAPSDAPGTGRTAPDLRPHLEWALRRIAASLDIGERYEAAQAALEAATAVPQATTTEARLAPTPARDVRGLIDLLSRVRPSVNYHAGMQREGTCHAQRLQNLLVEVDAATAAQQSNQGVK